MSKRLNIVLPETTVKTIDRLARPGERSRFIDKAVLPKSSPSSERVFPIGRKYHRSGFLATSKSCAFGVVNA